MTWELKRLTARSIEAALEKASAYRDLNQPAEAESICRDVLDVVPRNQRALRTLGLALTDQFPLVGLRASESAGWGELFDAAVKVFEKLESEYERAYYTGIAWERRGKVHLDRHESNSAFACIEEAIERYEQAEKLGSPDTPDPVLRYNRCVRLLQGDATLRALDGGREDDVSMGD